MATTRRVAAQIIQYVCKVCRQRGNFSLRSSPFKMFLNVMSELYKDSQCHFTVIKKINQIILVYL